MSLTVSEGSATSYAPIPEGAYPAVCVALIDLGLQKQSFEGKETERAQVVVQWEIPSETIEIDGEPMPRTISKTYTASLHERSGLRKDLKSWRGREFTADELAAFDLKNILGAPCLLQIIHRKSADKVYANIAGIMTLPKGMPKPQPQTRPYAFDIDEASVDDFLSLPEWLRRKVEASPTWQARDHSNETPPPEEPRGFDELIDEEQLPF